VPVEFHEAHGYARRHSVQLRMSGGRSWELILKSNKRHKDNKLQICFRYGWHQFCVDNGIVAGDTCSFRVVREATGSDDKDEEWEPEDEDDEAVLAVEVCKLDGVLLS
jgi:hypothetical protein